MLLLVQDYQKNSASGNMLWAGVKVASVHNLCIRTRKGNMQQKYAAKVEHDFLNCNAWDYGIVIYDILLVSEIFKHGRGCE